jgi:hypothetical protein
MGMRFCVGVMALVMASGITATTSLAQTGSDALRAMLTKVPVAVLGPPWARRQLEFADYDAAAVALASPPPGTSPEMTGPYGPARRAVLGAMADYIYPDVAERMDSTVGFALTDVRAVLSVSDLPDTALILHLAPRVAKRAATVLRAAGYADTTAQGYPALVRGTEDFSIDMNARNPADLFGGLLGKSSRVAFADDHLLQATGWPMLSLLARPEPPMMVDQPDIAALLDAVDLGIPPGAGLVRAFILGDQSDFMPGMVVSGNLDMAVPGSIGVPPWTIGLLADISDGRTEAGMIALVFATRALAMDAAVRMDQSWTTGTLSSTGATLADMTGVQAEIRVLGDGPFVTLLVATAPRIQSDGWIRNTVFDVLFMAWLNRELGMIGLQSDALSLP